MWFNAETRGFKRKAPPGGGDRTFVQFVLEPLYKIFSQARRAALWALCMLCCAAAMNLPMRASVLIKLCCP